jgi:hypothetical protein
VIRRSRRGLAALISFVVLVGLASCSGSDAVPTLWVVQGGWYAQLHSRAPILAERLFASPDAVILGAVPGSPRPIRAFAFASYADFAELIATSPDWFADMDTVMYDLERWRASPLEEQQDPATYFRRFAELARAHELRVIITPHQSLMSTPGGVCTANPGEPETDAYVRCEIAVHAALAADVVETQAQGMQDRPEDYRDFVEATAAQARAANPDVRVIAGLSVRREAHEGTLLDAWSAVRGIVDGYYLSIKQGQVDKAVSFLQRLPVPEDG